jgi:ABC-type nitrate/sulfonate/bicarbonate transport system substrate-binding protein
MRNTLWIYPLLITLLASCERPETSKKQAAPAPVTDTLRLALDWSPNILHAGIFLAEARSEFQKEGLHLHWFSTEVDNYQKKPILRLLDGEVDLSIGPSEHLFYYAADSNDMEPRAEAVASLLSQPQSAFAVKADTEVYSPSDWSDLEYMGYDTPLEEAIIQAMIKKSGGQQLPERVQPGRLQVWDAFLSRPDALVWIFTHWEGQMSEEELRYFYPNEWGVPYGYSSVLMARKKRTAEEDRRIRKFLKVIKPHYQLLASAEKEEKTAIVEELTAFISHSNYSSPELIERAWDDIQDAFYADRPEEWGEEKPIRWEKYLEWIQSNQLVDSSHVSTDPSDWFTNDLLEAVKEAE